MQSMLQMVKEEDLSVKSYFFVYLHMHQGEKTATEINLQGKQFLPDPAPKVILEKLCS